MSRHYLRAGRSRHTRKEPAADVNGRVGNLDKPLVFELEAITVDLDMAKKKQLTEGVELIGVYKRLSSRRQENVLVPSLTLVNANASFLEQAPQDAFQT